MIPIRTVLLLALVALVAAQQQSGPWWLPLALSTQRDLAFNQPLDTAALLGTHNSYNWWNASLGLNPTMEPTFNQRHSVTEQLTTFGVRYLELDVHYITANDPATGQPYFADPLVVCHSSTDTYDTCYGSSNLGTFCTTFGLVNLGPEGTGCFVTPGATPSARTQFGEVMTWLRANPNEFVFIYVEWRANLGDALTSFTTMLSDVFNTSRFTPSDLSANGGVWPSRKQMIANGKRVALHSMQQDLTSIGLFYETFNNQPGIYGGFNPNYEQVAKFTLYPACQSVGFKIDPLPNNKFLSFYEDRSYLTLPGLGTVLNGSEGTGAFDRTSLIAAQKCGNPVRLDMIDYDYLSGWIWSWEVNEPNYGNVAYMQASGRWKADNTYTSSTSRPFVCRNDTDGSLALSSATGSWLQGTTSCDPGTTWDVPRTALENDKLAATLSSGGTAWLRYWNWAFTTGTWTDAMPKCGDSAANTAAEQCDGGASCTNCLCTGGQLPTTPASTGCVATAGQTASPPPATPRGTFAPTTAPPPTTRPNLTSTSAAAAAYVAASLLVAALVAAIVV